MALDDAVQSGRIRRGDLALLIVFGAALTRGAAVIVPCRCQSALLTLFAKGINSE
jgi:hypothetical protein